MGTPSETELKEALHIAGIMREQDKDPHHIAKSLLSLNYRNKFLRDVLLAAELYLRGQGVTEHENLLKAIENAKREQAHAAGKDTDEVMV